MSTVEPIPKHKAPRGALCFFIKINVFLILSEKLSVSASLDLAYASLPKLPQATDHTVASFGGLLCLLGIEGGDSPALGGLGLQTGI